MIQTMQLAAFKPRIKNDEPIARYTYMKVGGPADYAIETNDQDDFKEIIAACTADNIPFYVIGGGSNTLFTDRGFRGLLIINRTHACDVDSKSGIVVVDSGTSMGVVVNQTIQSGLAGLAPFFGIPGTIGGAVYNNSHYLNELIGDYVVSCDVWDKADHTFKTLTHDQLNFAYDYSALQTMSVVILSIKLQLHVGEQAVLRKQADDAFARRKSTQPLTVPSSGCIFKNFKDRVIKYPKIPAGIVSAGALIDHARLKGLRVGGAEVSQVHANFIINSGNAKSQDIIDLANKISTIIREKYDITLESEVFFVNETGERISI